MPSRRRRKTGGFFAALFKGLGGAPRRRRRPASLFAALFKTPGRRRGLWWMPPKTRLRRVPKHFGG